MASKVIHEDFQNSRINLNGKKYNGITELAVAASFIPSKNPALTPATIEAFELLESTSRKSLTSGLIRAGLGSAILGPVGLTAALTAKNKTEHLVAIRLKTGEEFVASLDKTHYFLFMDVMDGFFEDQPIIESSSDLQTTSPKEPVPTSNKKQISEKEKNKKIASVMKFLIGIFIIMLLVNYCTSERNTTANTTDSTVRVIFDAPSYSGISYADLVAKMGEPNKTFDNSLQTSKGYFPMQSYYYETENTEIEFIVYENAVVRVHYFSKQPISFKNENELLAKFGTSLGTGRRTVDTGVTWRYQSLSGNVAGLDVYDIKKDAKTFKFAYITYNWNYFD